MNKLKSGDKVIVLSGKDKNRTGVILKVLPVNQDKKKFRPARVVVEGINVLKKHKKGDPQQNQPGGIIEKEYPMPMSKVAILNPVTGKSDRIGFKFLEDGKKVRIFKSSGEVVDV